MEFQPNPGKKLIIEVSGQRWARYPIKTHFISEKDSLAEILENYVLAYLEKGDIVVLGQKIISILEGKVVYKKDLKIGFWASFLSGFVKKTTAGFSVGNPLKMQLAINLAGLPRILLASILAGVCKVFKIYGVFYWVAGHQISQIDGFYDQIFPQYGEMGILGLKNCDNLCQNFKEKYGFFFLVADVNDLGGNILGKSRDLIGKEKLMLEILKDNPATQSNYQTPILILRELRI